MTEPLVCCECGKEIPIGWIFKRTSEGIKCEKCLGIQLGEDDYKVLWNGKFVPLSSVPSWAKQMFWGNLML